LISITDGQIYLSPSLFELGVLPAVDVGKSVSRVGGKAQRAAYRAVAGDLKLAYAQFEELETFSKFGARLDDDTRKTIEHGRRIRACLKQPEFSPVSVPAQIAVLLALAAGLFDSVPLEKMKAAEQALLKAETDIPADVRGRLDTADKLSDEDRKAIVEIARKALEGFSPKPDSKPEQEQKSEEPPEPEAKAKPKSESKLNDSDPGPESKMKAESNGAPKPEQKPGSKPRSDKQTQGKDQVDPKSNPEVKSGEANAEPKPRTPPKEKP
jgi:F-type H+-transporting ATPase subunit alpha